MSKENWKKKYEHLRENFDRLDRYNDILYRCYYNARKLRNSGYDGEFIGEVTKDLFSSVSDVEKFEKEIKGD